MWKFPVSSDIAINLYISCTALAEKWRKLPGCPMRQSAFGGNVNALWYMIGADNVPEVCSQDYWCRKVFTQTLECCKLPVLDDLIHYFPHVLSHTFSALFNAPWTLLLMVLWTVHIMQVICEEDGWSPVSASKSTSWEHMCLNVWPVGTAVAANLFFTTYTSPRHEDYPELSCTGMLAADGICSPEYIL